MCKFNSNLKKIYFSEMFKWVDEVYGLFNIILIERLKRRISEVCWYYMELMNYVIDINQIQNLIVIDSKELVQTWLENTTEIEAVVRNVNN